MMHVFVLLVGVAITTIPAVRCLDPENECNPNPCKHGTCIDGDRTFTCACDAGYTGRTCCSNIDDCSPNPCIHGSCVDGVKSHTCSCDPGFTSDDCSVDIDDCSPNPCAQNIPCTDGVNSHTCDCPVGYTGNCDTIDCFTISKMWMGKVSNTTSGRTCQAWVLDTPHKHTRHSDAGFPEGSQIDAKNYCRDPDGEGSPWCYTTDPNKRWEFCGIPHCNYPENECDPNPCSYVTCIDGNRTFTCARPCNAGYMGRTYCSIDCFTIGWAKSPIQPVVELARLGYLTHLISSHVIVTLDFPKEVRQMLRIIVGIRMEKGPLGAIQPIRTRDGNLWHTSL